jgi:hypothetical protein
MRKIEEVLRLHHECGRSNGRLPRPCGPRRRQSATTCVGPDWPSSPGRCQRAWARRPWRRRCSRRCRPPRSGPEPDWAAVHRQVGARGSPWTCSGRSTGRSTRRLPVQRLLRALPGLCPGPAGHPAPEPCPGGAAVRRLQRPDGHDHRPGHRGGTPGPDLRGRARGLQLHLCRGHLDPGPGGLDRLPCPLPGVLGGVPELLVPDNFKSGVTTPLLRPRPQPQLPGDGRPLRYCGAAGSGPETPRQGQGRRRGAPGPALDPGAPAPPALLQPRRGQPGAIRPLSRRSISRPFKKLPGSRQSVFEELDRPALKPLPATAMSLPNGRS